MSTVGIPQGVTSAFAVLQDYGIPSDGEYVCDSVASRGMLVVVGTTAYHAALVSGAMPATAIYLGFIEQDVVADNSTAINFGYSAQQYTGSGVGATGDNVNIWRAGRFVVTAVSGSVSLGALIYPQNGGKVGGTQVGSAPAVGYCTKANGTAGDPIEMELFTIGHAHAT